MKIRPSIILKVSENLTYAIDLDDNSAEVFRFDGPAALFIKGMINKQSPEQILKQTLEEYSDCTEEEVRADFAIFLISIEKFGFLQS